MSLPRTIAIVIAAAAAWSSTAAGSEPANLAPEPVSWCVPDLGETLAHDVCAYTPSRYNAAHPRTLVIYLHGVIQPETTWQWEQQRSIMRSAKAIGFPVIMPRGRRGIGPAGMRDWWTWPTSSVAQQQVEDELIAEWKEAQTVLEKRDGAPFDRVFVFGFSNGAYYASSLALRGKLEAHGYGIFAGGSAPSYRLRQATRVQKRAPIYVGYGLRDSVVSDARQLANGLRTLRWKHKAVPRPGVGHVMTDAQVREALDFLWAGDAP